MSLFATLFFTFLKIGIFNFGGGYAMIALIQNEVVVKHTWLTAAEFTDIVALSQMTPGPLGINVATYAGYTVMSNAGYPTGIAVLSAIASSLAIIILPLCAMLLMLRFLLAHRDNPRLQGAFAFLRIAVVGVLAAAACLLFTPENFGRPASEPFQFVVSVLLFATVFISTYRYKKSPILMLCLCGAVGGLLFYFF